MKNERGITLFALVVTIAVMLILAGAAIYTGIYENGGTVNLVKDETEKQEEIIEKEKEKKNSVLENIEEEWGIGFNV